MVPVSEQWDLGDHPALKSCSVCVAAFGHTLTVGIEPAGKLSAPSVAGDSFLERNGCLELLVHSRGT